MARLNWIDATGFGKQAKSELKLCDLRDISVLMLQWDDNNGVEKENAQLKKD